MIDIVASVVLAALAVLFPALPIIASPAGAGLDVDASGARLAMGSTTGNLWCSDDAGESWRNLAEHLPPIYAVRFGV